MNLNNAKGASFKENHPMTTVHATLKLIYNGITSMKSAKISRPRIIDAVEKKPH